MSLLYNTGDWFTLGPGNTFRKIELYYMEWPPNVELQQMIVAAAPYGGPIAVVRDWRQFVKVSVSSKPIIKIYTSSGALLSSLNWNSGTLLAIGWSDSEELLCIQDDGLVLIYDMFANYKHTFSMGPEAKDTKILDAKVYSSSSGTGIAVMTTNYRIFTTNSIKEPKVRLLPEMLKSNLNPSWWEILVEDRNSCCLVARDKEIIKLRQGDNISTSQTLAMLNEFDNIVMLSVSYNHKHLAVYTNTGYIWMGSADMKVKYCEFNTGRNEKPRQMEWCIDPENNRGADAVVISYPNILLVIGISGESNMYSYDPAIILIPEMDGVRVLTNSYHEVIQKVPKCVSNIFGINISEPSSFLFEAHRKFKEKSHQSDEYLCLIKDKLDLAVSECIEAAGYEFDGETQKSLIQAALFGKGFIPSHNPDAYIRMCRILRVLNAIRHTKVGIPLTYIQFNHLKPHVILDRLVFRKHYGLAVQIAKHLKLSESRILEHWAFHKVTFDKNDEEVARKIAEKFRNPTVQGLSFCTIAKKAQELGKTKLATLLLELEPKKSLQVPLLLKLGENKKALMAATQSGDTDLVYTVLLQLKETTQLANFHMTIRSFPLAQNLYKKYCQLYGPSALWDIFTQEDDFLSLAEFTLREKNEPISVAASAFRKVHKDVEADLCDEISKLKNHHIQLNEKFRQNFTDLSVQDTIMKLLQLGDIKLAEKLKNEFKVPERRYWWIRIQVLSQNFQWDELEKFSKSKKSPIGYEPFVEVCLNQKNVEMAKKYIPKCREENKIKLCLKSGLYEDASIIAFEQKDMQGLLNIHMLASNRSDTDLVSKIEYFITQLSAKK